MNQNNNASYGYDYRNVIASGQGRASDTFSNQNNNNVEPSVSNPTLLPYNEYMAMQKKNNLNQSQTSNTYPSSAQAYSQNRQSYPQPYYKGPNPGYQPVYNNPSQGQHNQYYPYQPLTYNYYGQPVHNPYLSQGQIQITHPSSEITSMDQLNNASSTILSNNFVQPDAKLLKKLPYLNDISIHMQSPVKNTSNISQQDKTQQLAARSPNNKQKGPSVSKNSHYYPNQTTKYEPKINNKYNQYPNQGNRKVQNRSEEDYNMVLSSNDDWSEEEEQEEMLYQKYQTRKNNFYSKSKQIIKKKDPIADDPEQIKKWIAARKRNYPGLKKKILKQVGPSNDQNQMNQTEKQQLSKLQSKIRKKLLIINGDSRSIMKKIQNIQILRRIIQDPKILKRQRKPKYTDYRTKSIEEIPQKIEIETSKPNDRSQQMKQEKIIQKSILQIKPQPQQISESQESIQPEEAPANKISREQVMGQQIQELKQIQSKQKQKPEQSPALFEFVDKESKPIQKRQNETDERFTRKEVKVLDPDTIIAHLKQKQQQDKVSLNTLFDYKSNSYSYNYRVQTLQTSLKLDQIFAETTYLLQAIRYIVKENFFDVNAKDERK